MSEFEKARKHFTEAILKTWTVAGGAVKVEPVTESTGGEDYTSRKTGPLFAFQANGPKGIMRGFAGADGTVALAKTLGPLFKAAGVPKAPTLSAKDLAHRVRWVLHPGFTELTGAGFPMLPPDENPEMRLESQGSGAVLTFFAQQGGQTGTVVVYKVQARVDAAYAFSSTSIYMVPQ
ncbi:MAG: hypothetical protein ACE366_26650 [Bradymonadia bacterium]